MFPPIAVGFDGPINLKNMKIMAISLKLISPTAWDKGQMFHYVYFK